MWYWILAWLLTLLTVFGNGLVIYLIISIPRLHTTPNWSVLSLAVADVFVGMTFFPLLFALNIDNLEGPPVSAEPFFLVSRTFLYFSATNLFVMILDRYLAIVQPLKYLRFVTTKVVVIAVTIAWISPILLFSVPYALKVGSRFLLVFRVSLFQFLPVIVFVFVTGQIFLIMRRISKRTSRIFAQLAFNHAPKSPGNAAIIYSGREGRAASKMTVAIIFFFVVCYVVENYKCFCFVFGMCKTTATLEQVIDLLFVINSAVNPVAYAFLKRDIKAVLQLMLTRREIRISNTPDLDIQGTETASSSEQRKEGIMLG